MRPVGSLLQRRLAVVDVLGALGLVWAVVSVTTSHVAWWTVPVVLLLQTAGSVIHLPVRVGQRQWLDASLAVTAYVLGLAVGSPAWVVLALAAVAVARQVVTRRAVFKSIFNVAAHVGPGAAGALLLVEIPDGGSTWAHAGLLLAAGVVYDAGNFLALTSVIAAATDDTFRRSFREGAATAVVSTFLGSAMAVLLVLDVAGVPTFVVGIGLALAAVVLSRRRDLSRDSAVDALPRLAAASRRIASLDATETITEVAERAVELFAADDVEVWLVEWPGSTGTLRWVRTDRMQGRWALAPEHGLGTADPERSLRMPLIGDAELLGEVRMSFGRQRTLSDAEQQVLAVYAAAAAGAVEHARTHLVQRRLARTDPLTGLPNRFALREGLEALLPQVLDRALALPDRVELETAGVRVGSAAGGPAAVILLDLDHFAQVNETLGYRAGDGLLQQVAQVLLSCARPSDLVSRLAGDQFCLVLAEVRDLSHARALADHVLDAVAGISTVGGLTLPVGASAGVALTPAHGTTLDELLRRAGLALAVSRAGRSRVQVFDPSMDAEGAERAELLDELRLGLGRGEVVVHYQPRVDVASGRVVQVEAVPRWYHPVLGFLAGERWAPWAGTSELAVPLALHVLASAIEQAARWKAETGQEIGVAADVAARCLLGSGFAGDVAYLLVKNAVPGRCLTLQVTERPDGAWAALSQSTVVALQGAGVHIGVVAFGAGAASMTALARAGASSVTLDDTVVGAALLDAEARAVVAGTVAVAHERGMGVGAAGVRNADDQALMAGLGVSRTQGTHHGEPMPADQLLRVLRESDVRQA